MFVHGFSYFSFGDELDQRTDKVNFAGITGNDDEHGDDAQGGGGDGLDLLVADGEDGDDDHVDGIGEFPAFEPVGGGADEDDAEKHEGTDVEAVHRLAEEETFRLGGHGPDGQAACQLGREDGDEMLNGVFAAPGDEFLQGLGAVAKAGLGLFGELAEGARVALRNEEGIVAKAAGAFGAEGDGAFAGAVEAGEHFALAGEDEDAAVAAGTLLGGDGVDAFELLEELGVVFLSGGGDAAVAGGEDAGGAVEGVALEAGVIGEGVVGNDERGRDGLERGVGEEAVAGFVHFLHFRMVEAGFHVPERLEDGGHFLHLVAVARGDAKGFLVHNLASAANQEPPGVRGNFAAFFFSSAVGCS
jgi:hypothetical protein